MRKRSAVLILTLIMATLVMSVWLAPTRPLGAPIQSLEREIPQRFGKWELDSNVPQVPPTPDVQAKLNEVYDQIVTRTYVNQNGDRIMLLVAYRADQNDAVRPHYQEVCYRAQGFTIRAVRHETAQITDKSVPIVHVHASQPGRSEPITYWTTIGNQVVWGRGERMLTQLRYGLRGLIADGLLVRVSSLSVEPETAYRLHVEFANDLANALSGSMAPRFFGETSIERRSSANVDQRAKVS